MCEKSGMSALFSSWSGFGKRCALITDDVAVSYHEFRTWGDAIANGVGERALVFLLCTNTLASIAGYTGFLRHRAVPVMMDAALDSRLLRHLVALYCPSFFWMPEERRAEFPKAEEKFHFGGYVLLSMGENEPFPLHDDLALLMTTSGSTGSPKLVRQSYENLAANTASIIDYLQILAEDRAITNLPMHYVYGLSIINTYLSAGASLVVTDKTLFDRGFWQLMREQQVTSLSGVPYTYEMLRRLRFFRQDLPALRVLTQAGGKLSPKLHAQFADWAEETGRQFVVMYGAAEATARMGWLPPEESRQHVGAMGVAIPGGRFELVDASGSVIETSDVVGELVYYGPNVTLGYAENGADLAKGDERHGRYETGDMAVRDAEGFYTIVGRRKRFLKMFGKRTNLEEAEELLKQRFDEAELACAGRDDELWIFATDGAALSEMKAYLAQTTGLHPTGIRTQCLKAIPRNVSGKVLYRELEHFYRKTE